MNIRTYARTTGTAAFIALILYLYLETAKALAGGLGIVFLSLFVLFSVISLIDAMQGGLKDKEIIS